MDMFDRLTLDSPRRTNDGYLVASARIARTGIQHYHASEVGKPGDRMYAIYRPEDTVFDEAAMISMAHKPITLDHPHVAVTSDNWRRLAVGSVGDKIERDGNSIRVPLVLMDGGAIAEVEAGKRELSVGYAADLEWGEGKTPDGLSFDAIQRNIRANHLAIVDRARGGPTLRIGDADMPDVKTRTVLVDGLSVETTDAGAVAIEKLQADLRKATSDTAAALAAAEKKYADAVAEHAKLLGAKDAEITTLKAKVVDGPALTKMVAEVADVAAKAKRIAGDALKTDGLTPDEIRAACVKAKIGDAATGKDQGYLNAYFDGLASGLPAVTETKDALRQTIAGGTAAIGDAQKAADAAYEAEKKRLADAWKGDKAA